MNKRLLNSVLIIGPIVVLSIYLIKHGTSIWALFPITLFLIVSVIGCSGAAIHISLFCFLLIVLPLAFPIFNWWPWHLLGPLVIYHIVILLFPKLRGTHTWLKSGHIDKKVLVLMSATIVVSAIALIGWYIVLEPDLSIHGDLFPDLPLIVMPLAGLGFALLNAVIEEFSFRGILMSGLENALNNQVAAIILQAIPFGLIHYIRGFPNGATGVSLTLIYGVLLGYIRSRSRGMTAPVMTHVFADLVIFSILLIFLR